MLHLHARPIILQNHAAKAASRTSAAPLRGQNGAAVEATLVAQLCGRGCCLGSDSELVHEKAEAKALTGALSFKLDAAAAAATQGGRAARLGWRGRAPYLVSRRLSVAKFYLLKLRARRTRPRGRSASRGAAARA